MSDNVKYPTPAAAKRWLMLEVRANDWEAICSENKALKDMLRRLEWGHMLRCKVCGNLEEWDHAPDCELARLLGEGE